MDYEKKLEQAHKLYYSENITKEQKYVLESLFPELKESERIRKALITFFQRFPYENIDVAGTNVKEAIAWLEKQGENNMGISEVTKQKLEDNLNKALEKETSESWNKFLDGKGEQKPTEWTAEDEEELKIALDTLEKAGQYSSAKWLKNVCLVPQAQKGE